MFVMEKVFMLLMIVATVTVGISMMASTVGTAQAVGCNHNFDNQGASCTDGVLCVNHFLPDVVCHEPQIGPP